MFTFTDISMTKQIYILLLVMFSFILTLTETYACSKSSATTEQACCKKEKSQDDKSSCSSKSHAQGNHDADDCSGKCGNSSCQCPAVIIWGYISSISELKYKLLTVPHKQFLLYTDPYISSGFHFIWQPPKIA